MDNIKEKGIEINQSKTAHTDGSNKTVKRDTT